MASESDDDRDVIASQYVPRERRKRRASTSSDSDGPGLAADYDMPAIGIEPQDNFADVAVGAAAGAAGALLAPAQAVVVIQAGGPSDGTFVSDSGAQCMTWPSPTAAAVPVIDDVWVRITSVNEYVPFTRR